MYICFRQTQALTKAIAAPQPSVFSQLASSKGDSVHYGFYSVHLYQSYISRVLASSLSAISRQVKKTLCGMVLPKGSHTSLLTAKADITLTTSLRTQHLSEAVIISHRQRSLPLLPKMRKSQKHNRVGFSLGLIQFLFCKRKSCCNGKSREPQIRNRRVRQKTGSIPPFCPCKQTTYASEHPTPDPSKAHPHLSLPI